MQAVVLSQFCQEPNYAQVPLVFSPLSLAHISAVHPGLQVLGGQHRGRSRQLVWLHLGHGHPWVCNESSHQARRGKKCWDNFRQQPKISKKVARRRAAKHCIWQLELNTNNDEEILNEAANVRRAMFLRWFHLNLIPPLLIFLSFCIITIICFCFCYILVRKAWDGPNILLLLSRSLSAQFF